MISSKPQVMSRAADQSDRQVEMKRGEREIESERRVASLIEASPWQVAPGHQVLGGRPENGPSGRLNTRPLTEQLSKQGAVLSAGWLLAVCQCSVASLSPLESLPRIT